MDTHHHHHSAPGKEHQLAFMAGISLNIIFVIIEIFFGLSSNSSALIADAGHNVSDVMSLILSWTGIWLATRQPRGRFSYGYKKSTILISILNAIILLIAVGFILVDALPKFSHPSPVAGNQVMIVAAIGIVINGLTALLFIKGQKHDLNIKGAFLHMSADAVVSMGVVIAGLLIRETQCYWIDPVMSLIIILIIGIGTWNLLVDSVRLAMDATPRGIDPAAVRKAIMNHKEVTDVHDLHIWALSTSENAVSLHLTINSTNQESVLKTINQLIDHEFKIKQSTIQIESDQHPICHFHHQSPKTDEH